MAHRHIHHLIAETDKNDPLEVFQLLKQIGSGTYGEVYKARKKATNEMVAVKVVKIDPKDDIKAILQEIYTLRDCCHPNIVKYHGSYFKREKLWLCMEYCEGKSLQDIYLTTRRSLQEDQIAFVCRETLKGLAYMHKKGKIHRDIKGANILLTKEGHVKLADFGVAAQITQTINKRNSFIGTPYWMAPEVAAVDRLGGYGEKCDIWAVGITAIECAEQQPPMFDLHPLKALHLLSLKSFKPPVLAQKNKWTNLFHNFLKVALTKLEKKRPTAEELLLNPFCLSSHLNEYVMRRLLELFRSLGPPPLVDDDDLEPEERARKPPERIHSIRAPKQQGRAAQRAAAAAAGEGSNHKAPPPPPPPHKPSPPPAPQSRPEPALKHSVVSEGPVDELSLESLDPIIAELENVRVDSPTPTPPQPHSEEEEDDHMLQPVYPIGQTTNYTDEMLFEALSSGDDFSKTGTSGSSLDSESLLEACNEALISRGHQSLVQSTTERQKPTSDDLSPQAPPALSHSPTSQPPPAPSKEPPPLPKRRAAGPPPVPPHKPATGTTQSNPPAQPAQSASPQDFLRQPLNAFNRARQFFANDRSASPQAGRLRAAVSTPALNQPDPPASAALPLGPPTSAHAPRNRNRAISTTQGQRNVSPGRPLSPGRALSPVVRKSSDDGMMGGARHRPVSAYIGHQVDPSHPPPLPPRPHFDENRRQQQQQQHVEQQQQQQLRKRRQSIEELGNPVYAAPTEPNCSVASNGVSERNHVGACFAKVFEGCPLKVNCTTTWVNPETRDQLIFFGTNDGVYYLNLSELHDRTMVLVFPRRCLWLYVIRDVMMSLCGGNQTQLYRHSLPALLNARSQKTNTEKLGKLNRLLPKRFLHMVPTIKVPDTKGCIKVCVARNPYHGTKYLCAALADHLILMEWVEPMHKFMEIRRVEHSSLPSPLLTFEMLICQDQQYPLVVLGCNRAKSSSGDMDRHVHFNIINLNVDQSKWYDDSERGMGEDLEVVNVTQLEKDAVLVCYKNFVKVVSLKGRLKPSHRMTSRLKFDFTVESVVCLRDSVLAFHKHGLQGRSFHKNVVTQNIYDDGNIYRLLGSDRTIVVESRPTNDPMSESNIFVLTGH